jgi:hypothetical protein
VASPRTCSGIDPRSFLTAGALLLVVWDGDARELISMEGAEELIRISQTHGREGHADAK